MSRCDTVPVTLSRPAPVLSIAAALALIVTGCDGAGDAEAQTSPSPSVSPTSAALRPSTQLAARAALGQDQHYSASYRFTPSGGGPAGSARVERTKAGVRLDILQPADAANVERTTVVVTTTAGSVYCRLTATGKGCVKQPPTGLDPRAQHAFTDWLEKFADPAAAISVAVTAPPKGAAGTCFSVEGTTASVDPPVDPGTYCFDNVGRITALSLGSGVFTVVQVGGAPDQVTVPAPVGKSVPAAAKPSPTPPATPSPGPTSTALKGKVTATPGHSAQPR